MENCFLKKCILNHTSKNNESKKNFTRNWSHKKGL